MVGDQTNRTFICSTVFVDLVGYSKKSVAEQLTLKDRFTAILAEALKDIDVNERIVLDTGDGAAMSFLGDPEDALFVGLSLRDALAGVAIPQAERGTIRIGINLGPVKLVKDINGHPNIVGDGINVAQRIMNFADPGQMLVSRSYFDVVSCLSEEYAALFQYQGARTDKHVRDHEVYTVGDSESAFLRAKSGMARRAVATDPKRKAAAGAAPGAQPRLAAASAAAGAFLRDRRKVAIAGGALGVLVVLLAVLVLARKPAEVKSPAAAPVAAAPAESPAVPAPEAKGEAAKPAAAGDAAKLAAGAAAKATAKSEPAKVAAAAKPAAPAKAEPPPGTVTLSVLPWGEVFVDGRSRGVSPPLKSLKLAPGSYTIEVRNTTFPPYSQRLEVKPREEVRFQHVFR